MAIRIKLTPATEADKEGMVAFRDAMCNALRGWQPYVNSDVLVSDVQDAEIGSADTKDGSVYLIVGPDTPDRDCEMEIKVRRDDLKKGETDG